MIFYIATDTEGRKVLVGTQADARAIDRGFEQVDIPTDKAGLMTYIQDLMDVVVVPEREQTIPEPEHEPVPAPEREPTYAAVTLNFEDQWAQFPLGLKLHYAALACEDAREIIKPSA